MWQQAASQMLSLRSQAQETSELRKGLRDTPAPALHHQFTKLREVSPEVSAQKYFRLESESKLLANWRPIRKTAYAPILPIE